MQSEMEGFIPLIFPFQIWERETNTSILCRRLFECFILIHYTYWSHKRSIPISNYPTESHLITEPSKPSRSLHKKSSIFYQENKNPWWKKNDKLQDEEVFGRSNIRPVRCVPKLQKPSPVPLNYYAKYLLLKWMP